MNKVKVNLNSNLSKIGAYSVTGYSAQPYKYLYL